MELSEMQARAAELEQQISALPAGSITKKTVRGKEYFYHRWTENKKRREKYIPADELENFRAQIERRKALEQERTNQQEQELVCEYEIDGISDFVFLNRFGQPQNPQTVNRAIKRISVAYNEAELEKAEKEKREPQLLPPFSCHNLRHTFCTRLCENETNLKIIQDIMGHRDISTTMEIYAEATKEAKAHSFANLNGKLGISV